MIEPHCTVGYSLSIQFNCAMHLNTVHRKKGGGDGAGKILFALLLLKFFYNNS